MPDDFLVGRADMKKYGFVNTVTGEPYSYLAIRQMTDRGEWPRGVWVSRNRHAWWYSELRARFDNLPRERPRPVR
jgi:hypothetical protein